MSSQLEETTYQNKVAQEIFDQQDPSQGVNYDEAELLTPTIVPGEVGTTEVEHEAQITTITFDSAVIEKPVSIIDREYFITKGQRINNVRRIEIGQEWELLRKNVLKIIDSDLNLQFILNAQNQGIKFLSNNTRQDVINIRDIGASYAQDLSNENVTKLNYVMYVWFMDNPSFLYDIEKNVMSNLTLEYDKDNETDMGCIARLVQMRKNDKVIIFYYSISIVYRHLLSNISFIIKIKSIICRGKATHQLKMSKQRTSAEKKDDAVRRPKVTRSFKLGDKWYNIDGSEYNTIGKLQSEIHSNPMKSEDDMKEQLKNMTSELCTYKERVSLMESNDKKVIVYSLCISCIDFFI